MLDEVTVATIDADYEAFGELVREYWNWLEARYADLPGFINSIAQHQTLEAELSALRETYGPPEGRVLLARRDGVPVGGIAYHDMGDGTCEMKRLFVPERYQYTSYISSGGTPCSVCKSPQPCSAPLGSHRTRVMGTLRRD